MRYLLAIGLAACVTEVGTPNNTPHDEWDDKLADRVLDYNAALRVAALRLTGELPTLVEMSAVATSGDPKSAYETQVHTYLASPKFARQMFRFWQDTLKMGDDPALDTAPAFAAEVTVQNRPFVDLLTATNGTCPTFDVASGTFVPHDCTNGVPATVGILTNPNVNKHFFSNFGFRRVRWTQETFACTAFPAEIATVAKDVGGATPYTGMFPFESIAGAATGGRVDFRDTSAVICANCHSNINHIAPLFAHFDETGMYTANIVVPTPLANNPVAVLGDYLPAGESLAWRFGTPVTDMTGLGHAMAADPAIAECVIARVWNWGLGKSDIIDGGNRVPLATIQAQVDAFTQNGYKLKDAIFNIFTSDDFVRF